MLASLLAALSVVIALQALRQASRSRIVIQVMPEAQLQSQGKPELPHFLQPGYIRQNSHPNAKQNANQQPVQHQSVLQQPGQQEPEYQNLHQYMHQHSHQQTGRPSLTMLPARPADVHPN